MSLNSIYSINLPKKKIKFQIINHKYIYKVNNSNNYNNNNNNNNKNFLKKMTKMIKMTNKIF